MLVNAMALLPGRVSATQVSTSETPRRITALLAGSLMKRPETLSHGTLPADGVLVGVFVGPTAVFVGVLVATGVLVRVGVLLGTKVLVGVFVGPLGVLVRVGVLLGTSVLVGVFVGPAAVFVGVFVGPPPLTGV